jgi:hypothetical protein
MDRFIQDINASTPRNRLLLESWGFSWSCKTGLFKPKRYNLPRRVRNTGLACLSGSFLLNSSNPQYLEIHGLSIVDRPKHCLNLILKMEAANSKVFGRGIGTEVTSLSGEFASSMCPHAAWDNPVHASNQSFCNTVDQC